MIYKLSLLNLVYPLVFYNCNYYFISFHCFTHSFNHSLLFLLQLSDENEAVKRDNERLQKSGGQESSGNDSELRRLRAENAALQKSLASKGLFAMR